MGALLRAALCVWCVWGRLAALKVRAAAPVLDVSAAVWCVCRCVCGRLGEQGREAEAAEEKGACVREVGVCVLACTLWG